MTNRERHLSVGRQQLLQLLSNDMSSDHISPDLDLDQPQTDPIASEPSEQDDDNKPKGKKRAAVAAKPAEWFEVDDDHNSSVYVWNLPNETSEEEFIELMSKYGLIMKHPVTNEYKIKMYRDRETGQFKGDALCTYIKVESVDLVLQLLDESNFNGNTIRAERAKFTLKGEYDASKKPKIQKKEKKKQKKKLEKLFDWRPDRIPGERANCEKVVIITNLFDMKEFAEDPKLILEYRSDVRDECQEKCGEVRKVDIYENNPQGAAAVFFNTFDSADACVQLMDGRFFAGRQLRAFHWDGKTKYKINETEEEAAKRMAEWDKFLEQK